MEPAGQEGTCHSGLEKGTICPTHVTGNTLGATRPPSPGVRQIIPALHPESLSQEAAAVFPKGRLGLELEEMPLGEQLTECRAPMDQLLPASPSTLTLTALPQA